MSARIEVGGYVIKPDAAGWVLGEPREHCSDIDEKPVERIGHPTYHATLESALRSALDRRLKESDARSLKDVAMEIRRFKSELAELFALSVVV